MLKKVFFGMIFISFFSCAPIQLEYDIQTQSSVEGSSFEEESPFDEFLGEGIEKETPRDYSLHFIQKLSNSLYENSSCFCSNNNDCSRGCSKSQGSCRGTKAVSKPTEYCMRHITGSIMHTIDQYCQKMNKDTSRDQCLVDMEEIKKNKEGKNNICRQSLFYPSALCVVNLDGQDRINSHTIKSKSIRNNCRYYNSLNANLRYFYAKLNNRVEKLPLFIEVPIESPEALPFGSIIVLQSSNSNGHVEVKTNKKNCKGSYCFCSDFCVSREGGWKAPYKPLVAFQWNPLFINYLGQWDEQNPLDFIY